MSLYSDSPDVQIYTDNNFDFNMMKLKGTDKSGYILYYAPWCPHCISKKPLWTTLAKKYKDKYIFGVVDTTNNPIASDKFNIMYFPTLKYLHNDGNISDAENVDYTEDSLIQNILQTQSGGYKSKNLINVLKISKISDIRKLAHLYGISNISSISKFALINKINTKYIKCNNLISKIINKII